MFASYASFPEQSRGRLFQEEGSAHRSCFQRDRDRIIHSSSFRRLKHKTQVFVEHEGDYYRTRLTHSIEVAQVARTISGVLGLNAELTEAVALAHDLGHTPFGHTGEDALHEMMIPYGGFDHNAQAIKIVTLLERHYADFNGLNLTWETLEGIAKHNGPVEGAVPYALANYVGQHDLELGTYASAEAQVAAISDDIAYNNHDLDDGLRAGLFTVEQLCDLPIIGPCFAEVDRKHPGLDPARRQHEALRRVFGVMVEDVIAQTQANLDRIAPETAQDIRECGEQVVAFSAPVQEDLRTIRAFFFKNMYRHWKVRRMRRKAAIIVKEMFEIFFDDPGMLPDEWQVWAGKGGEVQQAWVIADYIAGMTDRYALQEYNKLTDPMMRV
ncbi:deoxyguanosinetriphosphate triphosphohydrolase [Oceanomicrobium pacificus]|uniref:Deoxyguanosinetriphosphate triphosphohydrolase-like protein n=1 Tax=Oceanomicrobium pacificus TaxID=2692916 RepID=A0A6B0TLR5_9RHOB|nr:deoxyguanosinetriphosphate triphosphohydrolase [Oceanomicrobium pacificus]MXU65490.1 deoxyguanosinetriphosphate triphosphohydrolase [Oceanomicrobium pacificus]